MEELKNHVDRLFAGYRETSEIKELKEEILGNLEAKVADSIDGGMARDEAVALAMRSLDRVDSLIEGSQPVDANRYKMSLVQSALLYLLVAWIVTIPLRLLYTGISVNNLLTLAVLACVIFYLAVCAGKGKSASSAVLVINLKKLLRFTKAVWFFWGLYIIAAAAAVTIKHFGSAIWFGRALSINGPYQFAVVATGYAVPLITVIIPLLFARACTLAQKHEVKQ